MGLFAKWSGMFESTRKRLSMDPRVHERLTHTLHTFRLSVDNSITCILVDLALKLLGKVSHTSLVQASFRFFTIMGLPHDILEPNNAWYTMQCRS